MLNQIRIVNLGTVPGEEPRSIVVPRAVFAAGRQRFEVVVRGQDWVKGVQHARMHAWEAVFSALPLEELGWHRTLTRISLVERTGPDEAIWRLTRRTA